MSDFQLAVLNPGGNDPDQDFPNGAGSPDAPGHAPVNYHAFAACTRGSFLKTPSKVGSRPVLLLLGRDLSRAIKVLPGLLAAGNTVAVAFKEAGSHQIAESLNSAKQLGLLSEIAAQAHGAIACTKELLSVYQGAGFSPDKVAYIPTPYPLGEPGWNFSIPVAERRGIFIGTREFNIPSRRHLAALLMAKSISKTSGTPVTVLNVDGRAGRAILAALDFPKDRLTVIEGRTSYPEYLRRMAQHKLVLQLDRSRVPGQVAGDALLCGIPCIGGDGAVDQEAFPKLHGFNRTDSDIQSLAETLISSDKEYAGASEDIHGQTGGRVSYPHVRDELEKFVTRLK